jgi:hypothetical protein
MNSFNARVLKEFIDVNWAQFQQICEQYEVNADDISDALFTSSIEWTKGGCSIGTVVFNSEFDWKIDTPPKPDIVTYHVLYATGAIGGNYRDLESAEEFKANNVEISVYIKTTINGETGKITAEVIEL